MISSVTFEKTIYNKVPHKFEAGTPDIAGVIGLGAAIAYVENLGWVGFDPTNGVSTTDAHVRVAVGLDYLGAAPVRGTRYGGAGETLTVAVRVAQARQQIQN